MADNTTRAEPAAGTLRTIAADDVGGILIPRGKIVTGADGVNEGDVSHSANPMPAGGYRHNGSSWDKERGNTEGTLLPSLARTASAGSPTQTNHNARGVLIALTCSAKAAATTLKLRVDAFDGFSTDVLFEDPTPRAIVAGTLYLLTLYPGVIGADYTTGGTSSAIANLGKSIALPRSWGVAVLHSDASSITYSVSYQLIV